MSTADPAGHLLPITQWRLIVIPNADKRFEVMMATHDEATAQWLACMDDPAIAQAWLETRQISDWRTASTVVAGPTATASSQTSVASDAASDRRGDIESLTGAADAAAVNACPGCHGAGFVPDKPWKGPSRYWMTCSVCHNHAGLKWPEHKPTDADHDEHA